MQENSLGAGLRAIAGCMGFVGAAWVIENYSAEMLGFLKTLCAVTSLYFGLKMAGWMAAGFHTRPYQEPEI